MSVRLKREGSNCFQNIITKAVYTAETKSVIIVLSILI